MYYPRLLGQTREKSWENMLKVKEVTVLVAQSGPTFCNPVNCSPPGSSVHRVLQTRKQEWVAIPFSRGSSQPRDWICVSCIAAGFFTIWATCWQSSNIFRTEKDEIETKQTSSPVDRTWFTGHSVMVKFLSYYKACSDQQCLWAMHVALWGEAHRYPQVLQTEFLHWVGE